MAAESMPSCARCGAAVDGGDWWLAHESEGEGEAAFCRLEHIVPWAMKGPDWSDVTLMHHRGGHEIAEKFDSVEELRAWAAAGGPWAAGGTGQ